MDKISGPSQQEMIFSDNGNFDLHGRPRGNLTRAAGIDVVMDRCIKTERARLSFVKN